jgi:hypothetical protein
VRLLQHTLIALAFWIRAGSIAHAELIGVASVIDGDTWTTSPPRTRRTPPAAAGTFKPPWEWRRRR